jgi:hypothetical protein
MPNRGYIADWRPQAATRALFDQINAILTEYLQQLPLTLRQIFYRLVARYDFEKTRKAYDNLSAKVTTARRARWRTNEGRLLFDAIRDDSFTAEKPFFYRSERGFWGTMRSEARHLRLDRRGGQARALVLWCEAAGMLQQLRRHADPYGIPVYCSGGFDKVTGKREIGNEFAMLGKPITVLHIGDHDPSGIHIFESLAEDIVAFAQETSEGDFREADIEFVRVAITPDQADQYAVPTALPNKNDDRRFDQYLRRYASDEEPEYRDCDPNQTYQAEGLDPLTLSNLIASAINERTDVESYRKVLAEEEKLRAAILAKLAGLQG